VPLAVPPMGRMARREVGEPGGEGAADETDPLAEDRPAGEGDERPAGAGEVGAEGLLVGGAGRGERGAGGLVAGEVGRELGTELGRGLGEGAGGELAAVVDGAAEGDGGEAGAGRGGVPRLALALAGGGEEAVLEARGLAGEGVLGVEPGGEGARAPGRERSEGLEGQGRDAEEQEGLGRLARRGLGAQAGPPPSSSRRCT
jgi:hypothetical protein